jgi:hypothetical protein
MRARPVEFSQSRAGTCAWEQNRGQKNNREEIPMWLLLLLPFVGLLWVPFYNTDTLPALFGFPFFYWYQLLWVPITAFLIWLVYRDGLRKGVK